MERRGNNNTHNNYIIIYLFLITCFILFHIGVCEQTSGEEGNRLAEGELRLVVLLTRHGDRTPLRIFKNSPSTWPEGLGELTGLGMKQHYLLGKEYRRLLVEEKKFINDTYHRYEFYAQSSGVYRTLMSADSFVMGLYPEGTGPKYKGEFALPNGHHSIPIFSERKDKDFILYSHHSCPLAPKIKKEAKKGEVWKKLQKENEHIFADLSHHLGEEIDFDGISSVVTIHNAEHVHERPTIHAIASNHTLISHLKTLQAASLKLKYGSKEFGKLTASNLLREILHRMNDKHDEGFKYPPKLVLYSAHDTNILGLFSALDLISTLDIPHYGEHVSFEFYRGKDGSKENSYVVMKFNFEEVLIPGCPDIRCPLPSFTHVVESRTFPDVEAVCFPERFPATETHVHSNSRLDGEL